jgi:O-antigen/teichoic acid export membrane protein
MLKLISVKKIFGADLIKVSFLNAIAVFIKMIAAFVSMKAIAILSKDFPGGGPAAIALVGQLNNFTTILLSVCNGGITTGMTRYVAEYSKSPKKNQLFLGTGFWITTVLSGLTGLILILGAGYWSEIILKSTQFKLVFYVFGATIVMYAYNTLLIAVINGFKEYKKYVIANVMGSIVGLVFTIILSYRFGVYGALIALVTYQSVVFVLTLPLVRKSKWFKVGSFTKKFSKLAVKRLSHYSLMAIVTAAVMPVAQLVIRNYIIAHSKVAGAGANLNQAGLWESINRVSNMYLMVFATSLGVYYLPRLTELRTQGELRKEVLSVGKLVIPFLIIFSLALYFGRTIIIHVLFTEQFNGMDNLFAFQLLGDTIKLSSWILAYVMTAKSMTKTFIMMEFVSSICQVLFTIYFFEKFGTFGATMGYALTHTVYLVCMLFIFRKMLFVKPASVKS